MKPSVKVNKGETKGQQIDTWQSRRKEVKPTVNIG